MANRQCLKFDGVDDYVGCGNPTSLNFTTESFSITGWFKTISIGTGNTNAFVNKKSTGSSQVAGYMLHIPNGQLMFRVADGTNFVEKSSISSGLNDNIWHYAMIVLNRDTQKVLLYIDGKYDSES